MIDKVNKLLEIYSRDKLDAIMYYAEMSIYYKAVVGAYIFKMASRIPYNNHFELVLVDVIIEQENFENPVK